MFVNKLFIYPRAHISKSKRCFNVKPSTYYFQMKMKILVDFQICINVCNFNNKTVNENVGI